MTMPLSVYFCFLSFFTFSTVPVHADDSPHDIQSHFYHMMKGRKLGRVESEQMSFVGWGNACSCAYALYGFGRLGQVSIEDPIESWIGITSLPAGGGAAGRKARFIQSDDETWKPEMARKSLMALRKEGFSREGFNELLSSGPYAEGFEPVLAGSAAAAGLGLSGSDFFKVLRTHPRLAEIRYPPLSPYCALLVFTAPGGKGLLYKIIISRPVDLSARLSRAALHDENAEALFKNGDLPSALAEARIAAGMAPDSAAALYDEARFLCLSGYLKEALRALGLAVSQDGSYGRRAAADAAFKPLEPDPSFQKIVSGG